MKYLTRPLAPLLVALGAAILILTAGAEIVAELRAWFAGVATWPRELMLHVLIAGAALLLASAVIMTRRSAQRTEEAEAALRESEERLRLIANNVPALISYVDREQRYRFSNRTYDDWFGIAHERMHGRTIAEIFGDEAYGRMRPDIERVLAGATVQFELAHGEGGRRRALQVSCVPHLAAGTNEDGEVLGFYMLANDVTQLKRAQEDLRYAAIQLQHDARRLEFLAHHDTLTGLPNRAMFSERAREAVAHARRHHKTAALLFIDLDNFKTVNDTLGHDVGDALLKGIERSELFLVYQPRFDIATRQVVGAEALLRWRHPKYGLLAPESFLPLADDTGLLVPIGAWALREACIQGRRWIDEGISPLSIVVNVTSRQLRDGRLGEQVRAALEASRLPAESLVIEVAETVVRHVLEALESSLIAVTNQGARLGVDDFGTGYAALPTLQRLRASAVCIDRKLIAGIPQEKERAGLARALIALARGMNFDVVAKGVETQAQREFLAEAGCRVCQGDLFGPPNTPDAVASMLRARRAA